MATTLLGTTYYILDRRGYQSSVANVQSITEVDIVDFFDGGNYRDDPEGLLNATTPNATAVSLGSGGPGILLYSGTATALSAAAVASPTPAAFASDLITHIEPRKEKHSRTRLAFWSGKNHTQSITTVSGSPLLTVVSPEYLNIGQGVSGAGIVVGSTILDIVVATGVITLSRAATASATVTITFDTGRLMAEIWLDYHTRVSTSAFTRV